MQMIGKLGEDEKADWPGHLAEVVHAYNHPICHDGVQPTLSDVWVQAKAPSQLLLPNLKEHRDPKRVVSTKCVDQYIATVWDHLKTTLQDAQAQSMGESSKTEMVLQL